jgi:hypothetical protein
VKFQPLLPAESKASRGGIRALVTQKRIGHGKGQDRRRLPDRTDDEVLTSKTVVGAAPAGVQLGVVRKTRGQLKARTIHQRHDAGSKAGDEVVPLAIVVQEDVVIELLGYRERRQQVDVAALQRRHQEPE